MFLSTLSTNFFQNRVSFEGKNSGAGGKIFFSWANPRTNLGQVPPGILEMSCKVVGGGRGPWSILLILE